ncbi:hypothetical protein BGZ73_000271 [Actinomortierella ambigua]|nr:hypothetical protein BGZ73_000271 [Actinomortierella ambigua]
MAAFQLTCTAGKAVLDSNGQEMQENDQYYVCAAWFRESSSKWEFYGIYALEGNGQGYPMLYGTNNNQYRLWFGNIWDHSPADGLDCDCMDDRSALFENKEYSIGYGNRTSDTSYWIAKTSDSWISWGKTQGTGFKLHRYDSGTRPWYSLSVVGGDEVLGSTNNDYIWNAKYSDSKSRLIFRFGSTPMDCDQRYL